MLPRRMLVLFGSFLLLRPLLWQYNGYSVHLVKSLNTIRFALAAARALRTCETVAFARDIRNKKGAKFEVDIWSIK